MSDEITRLQNLLDERGAKYRLTMGGSIAWKDANGEEILVLRNSAGLVQIRAWLTPKQAIAATLGGGECKDVGRPAYFRCSECDWYSTVFAFGEGMPCYCPNCGRKVVD